MTKQIDLNELEDKARSVTRSHVCTTPPCCCCSEVTLALIARVRELESALRIINNNGDQPWSTIWTDDGDLGEVVPGLLEKGTVLP